MFPDEAIKPILAKQSQTIRMGQYELAKKLWCKKALIFSVCASVTITYTFLGTKTKRKIGDVAYVRTGRISCG